MFTISESANVALIATITTAVLVPLGTKLLANLENILNFWYIFQYLRELYLGEENRIELSYSASVSSDANKFVPAIGMENNHHLITAVMDQLANNKILPKNAIIMFNQGDSSFLGGINKSVRYGSGTNDPELLQKMIMNIFPNNSCVEYRGICINCTFNSNTDTDKKDSKNDSSSSPKSMANINVCLVLSSRHKSMESIQSFLSDSMQKYLDKRYNIAALSNQRYYFERSDVNDEYNRYPITEDQVGNDPFENFHISPKILSNVKVLLDKVQKKELNKVIFLITGVPGSGKSQLAKLIAAYTKRHLVADKISNMKSSSRFMGLLHSDYLYTEDEGTTFIPRSKRIIMFEEIDANSKILHERADKETNSALRALDSVNMMMMPQTETNMPQVFKDNKSEFKLDNYLTGIDGPLELQDTIIILTANHPDILDEAVTRPGRVTYRIDLNELDSECAEKILQMHYASDTIPKGLIADGELTGAAILSICYRCNTIEEFIEELPMAKADYQKRRNAVLQAKKLTEKIKAIRKENFLKNFDSKLADLEKTNLGVLIKEESKEAQE
jgi:hypothetical protein